MSANEITPAFFFWMLIQVAHHLSLKGWNILRVVKDWQPARSLMGRDSVESFEHLEVIDPKSAELEEMLRERGRPNAMGMKNRASTTSGSGCTVEQGLSTALRLVGRRDLAMLVNNHEVVRAEVPFVFATGRDQKSQWIAIDDYAVIAGCPQRPASIPKLVTNSTKAIDLIGVGF